MANVVLHNGGHGFFNLVNPWIAIFIYPAAGCANHMIMLFTFMRLLKLGNILAKLVLDNQPAIK